MNISLYMTALASIGIIAIAGIAMTYWQPRSLEAIVVEQAYKTADQTSTASTTLQNDTELFLPLQKNKTYIIDGTLIAGESDDCQIAFTVPTGAEMNILVMPGSGSGSQVFTVSGESYWNFCASGAILGGSVKMGNYDGNLQLQWALSPDMQEGTAYIREGSYLRADRVIADI